MSFTAGPDDRLLSHVLEGFEAQCNPKKNETVERYKFFQRYQEPGEPLERFITDLKVLATTCKFGVLNDSLVRDRIICGIQAQLREDLLKEPDLNLEKYLQTCRTAWLSNDHSKTLEDQGDREVHFVKANQKRVPKRGRRSAVSKDDKDHEPAANRCQMLIVNRNLSLRNS